MTPMIIGNFSIAQKSTQGKKIAKDDVAKKGIP